MKARGINFDERQVKKVLGGNMTQIRKVMRHQPNNANQKIAIVANSHAAMNGKYFWYDPEAEFQMPPYFSCPFGKIGDELFVRETWKSGGVYLDNGTVHIEYKAGGRIFENREDCGDYILLDGEDKWHPSTHMPEWMSRIRLRAKDIRVERLQDITEDDAKAEGCWGTNRPDISSLPLYTATFRSMWDSVNAKRGFGWDKNLYVQVLEFERID